MMLGTEMTLERYEVVRGLYVVVAYDDDSPFFWNWLLWPEQRWGDRMPRQVANRAMRWRRPTYEEAVARQHAYVTRTDWRRLHDKHMHVNRRRRLAVPAPVARRETRRYRVV